MNKSDKLQAILDTKVFYEYCQAYRHSKDAVAPIGVINAAQSFKMLRAFIINAANSVYKH